MKKIILRADDLGFSRGINYGIYDAVKAGLIQSVGVMVNMEATQHGVGLLREIPGCCFGLHTNLCAGRPISAPEKVPSLVDAQGVFYSSARYRNAEKEFISYADARTEIDAQYRRFIELFGCQPAYFEAHAIKSQVMMQALKDYAKENNLLYHAPFESLKVGNLEIPMYLGDIMNSEYDPWGELQECVRSLEEDIPKMYVFHPGYLDQTIMNMSSLTINRTKETAVLTDPKTKAWLEEQAVRLCSYRTITDENNRNKGENNYEP